MANKVTKREMFLQLRKMVAGNADMVKFIDHEIELLDKKKGSAKMTKNQEQNIELMLVIHNVLTEAETPLTVTEIQRANPALAELSNQKVSALLRLLVEKDEVKREVGEKRKTVFSIA